MDDITRKLILDAAMTDKLIRLKDFLSKPYLAMFLQAPHRGPWLPTETVVDKPGEVIVPNHVRWYPTTVYLWMDVCEGDEIWTGPNVTAVVERGQLLDLAEVAVLPAFKGTSNTPGLFALTLYEVWENDGSDGHIDYVLVGYRFTWRDEGSWLYDNTYVSGRPRSWTRSEDG